MKIVYIILILLFSGFVFSQIYVERSTSNTEEVEYVVLKRLQKGVEIRKYSKLIVACTQIPAENYSNVSSQGFRRIAGYIFGGNERQESIAMTAPVQMSFSDTSEMMFYMPSKFTSINGLPTPNDKRVRIRELGEREVAAISFKGWANDKTINRQKEILVDILKAEDIVYDPSSFAYLGYNPPYQLSNRRNEIIVTLKK